MALSVNSSLKKGLVRRINTSWAYEQRDGELFLCRNGSGVSEGGEWGGMMYATEGEEGV